MAKGYWISAYRSISDKDALAEYAKLALPAIEQAGGRFVARSPQAEAREGGLAQRTVVVEYDSYEQAVAAYDSDAYKAARDKLGNAVDRDFRIIEGV